MGSIERVGRILAALAVLGLAAILFNYSASHLGASLGIKGQ